ncbi:hypothetical protein D3C81_1355980 [compost metagenome]
MIHRISSSSQKTFKIIGRQFKTVVSVSRIRQPIICIIIQVAIPSDGQAQKLGEVFYGFTKFADFIHGLCFPIGRKSGHFSIDGKLFRSHKHGYAIFESTLVIKLQSAVVGDLLIDRIDLPTALF